VKRSSKRAAYELPLLLAAAFRTLIDELHGELEDEGHPHARPVHGFALQALDHDGATITQLGRRLGISKQAAAKTAAGLEQLGYAARVPDSRDGRAVRMYRTPLGEDMLAKSAAIFERIHHRYERALGRDRLVDFEDTLAELVGHGGDAKLGDLPGWLR
jgi:DNA-binding MarR family transcriptional regulator